MKVNIYQYILSRFSVVFEQLYTSLLSRFSVYVFFKREPVKLPRFIDKKTNVDSDRVNVRECVQNII